MEPPLAGGGTCGVGGITGEETNGGGEVKPPMGAPVPGVGPKLAGGAARGGPGAAPPPGRGFLKMLTRGAPGHQ
jgi:hypothetical protein